MKGHMVRFTELFHRKISLHFRIEEVVFPELKGERLINELLAEHREIKSLLKGLSSLCGSRLSLRLYWRF